MSIAALCCSHHDGLAGEWCQHVEGTLGIRAALRMHAPDIASGYNSLAAALPPDVDLLIFMHHDTRILFPVARLSDYVASMPKCGVIGFAGVTRIAESGWWWAGVTCFGGLVQGKAPSPHANLCFARPTRVRQCAGVDLRYEPVEGVDAYCLVIPRAVFEAVGGFSDYGPDAWHFYDMDICLKGQRAGYQNYVIDELTQHYGGGIIDAKPWVPIQMEFQRRWGDWLRRPEERLG